jgi:acyl dehydratase
LALNYEKIIASDPGDIAVRYTKDDSIFYALSIGIGMDPTDAGQLKYVYEKNLEAFPSMASTLGWMGRLTDPEYGIDARMVVASDLGVELHAPLPAEGELVSRPRVKEVVDKGAGNAAIIQFERELYDVSGTKLATIRNSVLARNHGGFGGKATALAEPHAVPEGAPNLVCDLPTPPNLALLFRLNGDTNPIHVDPERARAAGFARPLLHGAASYGIAAHALMRSVAGYRTERFVSMEARFARPVFPGETLRTEIWMRGDEVSFRCRTVERGDVALNHGLLRLKPGS